MKLHTSIPPRRDGTVKVTGQDSQTYVFEADAEGELSCDVAHEPTIAWLLATDNFYPADPADAERAVLLVTATEEVPAEEDPDDDDEADDTALPIESNTPPVRKKPGPKPKAKTV